MGGTLSPLLSGGSHRRYGRGLGPRRFGRGLARASVALVNLDKGSRADVLIHRVDFGHPSLLAQPSSAPHAMTALPRRLYLAVRLRYILKSPSKSGGWSCAFLVVVHIVLIAKSLVESFEPVWTMELLCWLIGAIVGPFLAGPLVGF
ncbi:hypothetical protein NL676_032810 [Syzygium grande]|nr:hypothetical protein NL676_032810 [Syzygium grande]